MPELIEQLAGTLGIPVRTQGSLRLVHRDDCWRIVEACRSNNVFILGIEAFTVADGKVKPDTELIADFSSLTSVPWVTACCEAARSAERFFVEAKNRTDLLFDFTLKGSE